MSLQYQVESIDGLDESIASLYTEGDNGYVLKVDGLPEVEVDEPVVLKDTLKKVRRERKDIEREKKQLANEFEALKSKYESIDFDEIEELKTFHLTAKQKEEELAKEEAKKRGEWEALESQIKEEHISEVEKVKNDFTEQINSILNEKESTLKEMQSSLDTHLKEKDIIEGLSRAKGNIPILKPHISPFVKVINENGVYVSRIIDSDGEVRTNETGSPLSMDEFIAELKGREEFQGDGIFMKEKTPGGSDSTGNKTKAPSSTNPWTKEGFNLTKQGEIVRQDPALAKRLKEEAGV